MSASQPKVSVSDTTLKDLQKHLSCEAHRWFELGYQLKIPYDELKKIENSVSRTPVNCFRDVVEYWLKKTPKEHRKWKVIYEALNSINKKRLSRKLQNETDYYPDLIVPKTIGPELVDLLKEAVPQWYMFGQNLEVPRGELKSFKDDKGVDQCFSDMLDMWLDENATWNDLVEALEKIGNPVLAREIESTYIKATIALEPQQTEKLWYAGVDEEILSDDDEDIFFQVLTEIITVTKWEELGFALKLKPHKLEEIRKDNHATADCRKRMLRLWFKEGQASWKSLCLALDQDVVGENVLARKIARKIKGDQDPVQPYQYGKHFSKASLEEGNDDGYKVVGNEGTMATPEMSTDQHDRPKLYNQNSSGSSYINTTSSSGISGFTSSPGNTRSTSSTGFTGSTNDTGSSDSSQQLSTPSNSTEIRREESTERPIIPHQPVLYQDQSNPYRRGPHHNLSRALDGTIPQNSASSQHSNATGNTIPHPHVVQSVGTSRAFIPSRSYHHPDHQQTQALDGTIPSPSQDNNPSFQQSSSPEPMDQESSENIPHLPQPVESMGMSRAQFPHQRRPMHQQQPNEPISHHFPQPVESMEMSRAQIPHQRGPMHQEQPSEHIPHLPQSVESMGMSHAQFPHLRGPMHQQPSEPISHHFPQPVESIGMSRAQIPHQRGPMDQERISYHNPQPVESMGMSHAQMPYLRGDPNLTADHNVYPIQSTNPPLPNASQHSQLVGMELQNEERRVAQNTSSIYTEGVTEHNDNTDNPLNEVK